MCKALELSKQLFDQVEKIENEYKGLCNQLSVADKKKTDIEHYIELTDLDQEQGYKAMELLKQVLQERRDIKNKMSELQPLLNEVKKLELHQASKKQSIEKKIEKQHDLNTNTNTTKKYNVRVLTEIFGKTIVES